MVSLYRMLTGYVRICVYGEMPERLINICSVNNISIWSISRKSNSIELNIGMNDYKGMMSLRHSIGMDIKVRLVGKFGMPITINRFKRRPGICIGLAVFFAVNLLLSQFIWIVDVTGTNTLSKEAIIEQCAKINIHKGVLRGSIDTYDAAQIMALKFDEIAWISINIEGSKLTVNVSEATKNEDEHNAEPRDIVAGHDGVIKRLEVVAGEKQVSANQAVRKGDLLVSGVVEYGNVPQFLKSEGLIIAETYRNFVIEVDKSQTMSRATGMTDVRRSLEFFTLKIPLYLSGVEQPASTYLRKNYISLFGVDMPIGIAERRYVLYSPVKLNLAADQAKSMALSEVAQHIRKLSVEEVLRFSTSVKEEDSRYIVTVDTVCLENICEYKPIENDDD